MPHDEGLAQRIRELLEGDPRIAEKRMFGGVAFMANGNMAVGIIRDELMVRVGPDAHDAAVALPHARMMDFTGRPMRGFVQVAPAGFEDDDDLRAWIQRGVSFAVTHEKKPRAMATRPKKPAGARKASGEATAPVEPRRHANDSRAKGPRTKARSKK